MKKKLSVTLELVIDSEYYDDPDWLNNVDDFEEIRDCDYDTIGRPLGHMEDEGWKIVKTEVK